MSAKIEVVKTDITTLAVDAIVDAAKHVAAGRWRRGGAIHRAAGPELSTSVTRSAAAHGRGQADQGLPRCQRVRDSYVGPVLTAASVANRAARELLPVGLQDSSREGENRWRFRRSVAALPVSGGARREDCGGGDGGGVDFERMRLKGDFACFGMRFFGAYMRAVDKLS